MSKNISVKLDDTIYRKSEKMTKKLDKSRNAYINEAVDFYTRMMERKLIKEQLVRESEAVYESSLEVLKDFERLEDELPE